MQRDDLTPQGGTEIPGPRQAVAWSETGLSSRSAAGLPLALTGRLRETLDNMLEGCQIIGYDWRYLYVNDAAAAHGRISKEKLLGKTMMDAYPGIEKTEMFAALRTCMEERVHSRLENQFTYPDGETDWFELSIEPVPEGIVVLSVDIGDRKRAEESLRRTGRALRTLCSCNQATVRATDERQLLREVCRIIVEVAGYRLAWAGLAQSDAGELVLPVAQAGYEDQDAPNPGNVWPASKRERSRVDRAISTGEPMIYQDILTDPELADYREEAERFGYMSSIALPLRTEQEVMGALSVYAREPWAFEEEEAELLQELADGLAYGMAALRARSRGEQLDGQLRDSEKRYQLHFEHVSDLIYSLDRRLRVRTVSPSVRALLGYAPEELIGKSFRELGLVSSDSLDAALADISQVLSGEAIPSSVYEFMAKDGTRRFVELSGAPIFDGEEISGLVSVARDVTDRMGTERALEHTLSDLRQVLGGMINILGLIVEQRDPYTAGHQRRVANLARAIATDMGVSLGRQGGIRVAASIHDLGKVSVPAEILSRPGRLSGNELKMVQAHAQIGYGLLREVEFPWPVADIVLQHHERLDGSGYPHHLCGEEILLEARIVALADVVDAMASHRPYRPAFTIEEVMEEITRERGTLYDAQAVDACLKLFREEGFQLR
jgi:PAS domain S-box-containing protein